MQDNEYYDLLIIGGGPAGLSAGLYAMRAALKTGLIEKGAFGGQVALTKDVENYHGFERISGFDLSEKFLKHTQSYEIELIRAEVKEISPGTECHYVILDDERTLCARAVILATGSSPRKLNVSGEKRYTGHGVSYCATCDGLFFRNQTVVVVGGGNTATEEAIYLAHIAKRVHVVHLEDSLRSSMILQNRLMGECNVELHPSSTVSRIIGDGTNVNSVLVRNVHTEKVQELPTDGVFIFIGLSPNNQLAPSTIRRTPGGHVFTDEKCETSIPGIFAVGDLRHKYANQIAVAVGDGCTGALAAAHYIEMTKEEKLLCQLYYPAA